jgi:hypothetical protein
LITKRHIADLFLNFGAMHSNIGHVEYAVNHLWEVDKDLVSNGQVLYINSVQGNFTGVAAKWNYDIFCMDVINSKEDNSIDVESDTYNTLLDLMSYFAQYDVQVNFVFGLDKNGSNEPFRERFSSMYCGNILRMTITAPFSYNTCKIPYKLEDSKIFDLYPNDIKFGWAFKPLKSTYSEGKCLTVRRESDNTTQDIYFVDGVLDTDSIATFCGASNGIIETVYSHSDGAECRYGLDFPTYGNTYAVYIYNGTNVLTNEDGEIAADFGLNTNSRLFMTNPIDTETWRRNG